MELEFNTILEANISEADEKTSALIVSLKEKADLQAQIDSLHSDK